MAKRRAGCIRREEGGVWNPKFCVPKMGRINISFVNLVFSHYDIWVQGWGRGSRGGGGVASDDCRPF